MKVSIIVPAYKQEKTIKEDIENIHKVMSGTRWDFEVIVVVDGTSVDKTYANAKKIKNPNVSVVGYDSNRGKGYAVRYGFARAKGDPILFIDSGMDIDPNGISLLLEHMFWYEADIIVGSKRHLASKVSMTFLRKVYSLGYHYLVRLLFGLKVRDTQSGLKIFRREVLTKVLPRVLVKRFAVDIELLAVAKKLGFTKIYEGPIRISLGKQSSSFKKGLLFTNPDIKKMLLDTFAIYYRMYITHYYDDGNKRKWRYDKELDMRVNTGK